MGDLIEDYMVYTEGLESPDSYHKWVALSTIAGVVGRKVWTDLGYFAVWPNLYVILVGPAGRCRKSAAMSVGTFFLRELKVATTADSSSRAGLIEDLKDSIKFMPLGDGRVWCHSSMTAVSSEFSSLLATDPKDMLSFLTDIYDCPPTWKHKTRGQGLEVIEAPYLNLLAATTPRSLNRYTPEGAIAEGFTSRVIFVYEENPRFRNLVPNITSKHSRLKESILKRLEAISMLHGEMSFSDEAFSYFNDWYKSNVDQSYDARIAPYFERKHWHVAKLSMLMSMSEKQEPPMVIEKRHIVRAITELEAVEQGMKKLFTGVGENRLASYLEDIANQIKLRGEIDYNELLGYNFHNITTEEYREIIDILVATKRIAREYDPQGKGIMLKWIRKK